MKLGRIFNLIILGLAGANAFALDFMPAATAEIEKIFPGAKIELLEGASGPGVQLQSLRYIREDARGNAYFQVNQAITEYPVRFRALKKVWMSARRLQPGTKLSMDDLRQQEVDLAQGIAHEYRGVLMGTEYGAPQFQKYETRQTILESQFLLQTALTQIPDVRRGESVRVRIHTLGVVLSTTGLVQEPGYMGGDVRVLSSQFKKELTGKLSSAKILEVQL